jgi:replication factor C large subunit
MSQERRIPWVVKYRPSRIADVVNQEEAKKAFLNWLDSWLQGKPERKAALLYGPPGSGKTSLVEAAAREYGLELLEMNASDYRRASDIERVALVSSRGASLVRARGKIILLDEVDGISATADLGALDAIVNLINKTSYPVVLVANDPWDPKLRELREVCLLIEFKRLTKTEIKKVLQNICRNERLDCEDEALNFIAERAEGDLRSAINDIEALGEGFGRITYALARTVLGYRNRELNSFEVVRRILTAKYSWQARVAASQTDLAPDELIQWINENVPRQAVDPEDLWRAFESLSRADIYMARVVKSGSWDLLAYASDMMTAGVALAITNPQYKFKWVKYGFPEKIRMLSKTKEVRQVRDDLAKVIAQHLKCSTSVAKSEVIPLLRVIFDNNPEYAARLALGLGLGDSMIKYLSERNGDRVVKLVEDLRAQLREALLGGLESPSRKEVEKVKPATKKAERRRAKSSEGLKDFLKK